MTQNNIRRLWASGKPVLNGWLSIGNAFTAEILSQQGYDALTIDQQHGFLGHDALAPMLQAMKAAPVTPMVRVPWLSAGDIMKALDGGALGIICPMVNTVADAARLVSYMRYPPHGQRSFGPTRANFSAGRGYASEANDEILCLAMIETAEAMENLEAIVATPGLDGVYIGPADLTLGITNGALAPGFDREEPQMLEAIHKIRQAASDAGIRACIHCGTPEYAARALGWGFNMSTLSNDVRLLASQADATVKKARALMNSESSDATPTQTGGY